MYDHLPGGEILRNGLKDLEHGITSIDSLLVLVAAPRLTRCGIPIPQVRSPAGLPEHDLFRRLCVEHGPEAYRHYRSLMRRLVSLENALDVQSLTTRGGHPTTPHGTSG